MTSVILMLVGAGVIWAFIAIARNPAIGGKAEDFDQVIDRIFRFMEMNLMTGGVNVVLRTICDPVSAFVLTLPFAGGAFVYLVWPIYRRLGPRLTDKLNRSPALAELVVVIVPIIGLAVLGMTLWIASLLSRTVSITIAR